MKTFVSAQDKAEKRAKRMVRGSLAAREYVNIPGRTFTMRDGQAYMVTKDGTIRRIRKTDGALDALRT